MLIVGFAKHMLGRCLVLVIGLFVVAVLDSLRVSVPSQLDLRVGAVHVGEIELVKVDALPVLESV